MWQNGPRITKILRKRWWLRIKFIFAKQVSIKLYVETYRSIEDDVKAKYWLKYTLYVGKYNLFDRRWLSLFWNILDSLATGHIGAYYVRNMIHYLIVIAKILRMVRWRKRKIRFSNTILIINIRSYKRKLEN